MFPTEFEFTLPVGYVDGNGVVHKQGAMRLATALDEIAPLNDPRVRANAAYLTVVLLTRVITRLGSLPALNTGVIEALYVADLAYLQALYRRINEQGKSILALTCPHCKAAYEVDLADLGGS
ncbi:MAG: hypothetical protein JNK29_19115 [Anaerolineales bacterium]|nr:hypothetical protein [Anaerolineales bacterium]